ncbi:uncharacterized protein PFLUO_LOCUS4149, partial [Penicillium psychrofluorescens]|uniref:uncharacterized protein n=1 Tax=Penicillium psychrofluorescens TaxID=3158075 RepID=UPI003CCDF6B8
MTYDRDEVVAAVTSFYKFLINTHIPSSALKLPPQDGWPKLTDEWLSFMEKSATVRDLIRHLPYLQPGEDGAHQIYPYSNPIDFMGEDLEDIPEHGVAEPQIDCGYKVGKGILTISAATGRVGSYFMVDTERGTISLVDYESPTSPTELSQKQR